MTNEADEARKPARYLSCTETAKLVRVALKRAFPTTKFSVRSSTYSMGASLDVSWFDGPRTARVDPEVQRFAGATFDGMIDLKSHHESVLEGERVHFGADFVFCHRRETEHDAWHAKAVALIRERCHVEGDRFGNHGIQDLANGVVRDLDFTTLEPLEPAFRRVVLRETLEESMS